MKRFLGALVSLSLIIAAAPPAAWAQFSEAASAGAGASVGAGAASASALSGAPRAIGLGLAPLGAPALSATGLSALSAPSAPLIAPGLRPFELTPHAVKIDVPARAAASAAPAVAVPASAVETAPTQTASAVDSHLDAAPPSEGTFSAPAADARPSARAGLFAAAAAFASPAARPVETLERLFTGAGTRAAGEVSVPVFGAAAPSAAAADLQPSSAFNGAPRAQPPVPDAPQGPRRSKTVDVLISVGRIALAAGATLGAGALAAALSPALFGVVPAAAVWAVSSGALLLPAALYARYRLARRDSPRLANVKLVLDVAIGAYVGALIAAAPSVALVLSGAGLLKAAIPLAGLAAGLAARGAPFLNSVMVWGALAATPLAIGAAAAGGLALAPILGMLSLPVMTTVAFFLGSLITAAETGRPFSVPGSLQKMRFPSFQWVMTGVTFALLAGYSAVYVNAAFLVWQFLGSRQPAAWDKTLPLWKNLLNKAANFDLIYGALFAVAAVTGFHSPLTFLVLAFSGERAAVWAERLLGRFLPRATPAPSTKAAPQSYAGDEPTAWPQFHYWPKTFLILASMAGIGALMGATVFGFHSLLTSLIPAALLAFVPFWFATKIIKLAMHDTPADEAHDPEFFAIMHGLRERINARRRAKGQKEIPMPEMVNDPLPLPNAYATGRDPFHALVGVTAGIKEMTLDPENVRDGVARLIANTPPNTKAFSVFRLAVSGSIPGVTLESSPADIQAAVLKADRASLKALGVRMLTGVLGHEFSHVMDRHMLSGSIAGAISSSIAFASYGVMWAVGHAQVAVKKVFDRVLGRGAPSSSLRAPVPGSDDEFDGGQKPEFVDPISVGVAVKSLPALLKLFAALWVPVLVQIVQMASSRNNEGMADEDGALLSEDPQSLALALGLLTTWRPKQGFSLSRLSLPSVIALSHIMTVNPLQQAHDAGVLPKMDAATEAVVGKGDDFLFDLFVTHPDTMVRIERLHDMAEALRVVAPHLPRPPDSGVGGKSALVGPSAPAAPESATGGGIFSRVWEKVQAFFRVLPDAGRNRAFWNFTLGQALVTVGFNFHYTALPGLLSSGGDNTSKITENRAIGWSAQAGASLLTGPLVDRQPAKRVIVWAYLGRGVLMAMVPVLFLTGHFGFAAFSALIALAGFLQATTMNAASVAFNRILGDDESYYNRANAVSTIVTDAVGVVAPLIAGGFIAYFAAHFPTALLGNAMSYGVYALTLLMAGVGYAAWLKIPRDDTTNLRRGLQDQLKTADLGGAKVKGVSAGAVDGKPGLIVEVAGVEPAEVKGLPKDYQGYPVKAVAARNPMREMIAGFRIAWNDKFLRLYLLTTTLSMASGDALTFASLTRYLTDVLHAGAGAFGLFLAASSLGLALSSVLMTFAKDPAQAALAPAAAEFRAGLAARDASLDANALDRAAAALRSALPEVLERYKTDWQKEPTLARGAQALSADVLAEAATAVGATLKIDPKAAAALLEATGASNDVRQWAKTRGAKLLATGRKDAKTGMDSLQRQGRWTAFAQAASWIVYAGMFFSGGLHMSIALMLLSSVLAGASGIVWSSLSTRVIAGNYPQDQGKVYSAMSFYWLACSVVGVLGIGALLTALSTAATIWVTAGVLAACALFSALQAWRSFPLAAPKR